MAKNRLTLANNPLLAGPAFHERLGTGLPYRELSLESIDRDPNQPRVAFDEEKLRELTESIRQYGVLSPVLVRPERQPGKFRLIAGERRLRAAHRAGLTVIPALVDADSDETSDRVLAIQLVENLQRSDLTALERAHAIGALRDTYSLSVREIASRLGISKSMVQRSLEILELPDDLLNALREGAAESKVLLLAKVEDVSVRASLLKNLDGLSRENLKIEVEKKEKSTKRNSVAVTAPEDRRIAEEVQRALGLRVQLSRLATNSDAGRISIEFYSDGDLQEVFRRLITS